MAIADYNSAIKLRPNNTGVYYSRAMAHFTKGENDKAIADYTKVIALVPDHAKAHYDRGIIWLHMKEWEKANSDLAAARNMGVDIIAEFHRNYESVKNFEQKDGVHLPEDIAGLLTQ